MFSFGRGFRTAIYVKMNDEYQSMNTNATGSSTITKRHQEKEIVVKPKPKSKTPPKKEVINPEPLLVGKSKYFKENI